MLSKEQFEEITSRMRKELDDLAFNLTLKIHLINSVENDDKHIFNVTMYIEEEVINELLDYADEHWNYDDMMENLLDDSKCFEIQGYSHEDYEYFDGIFVYKVNRKNKLKQIRFEPCSVNMFDAYTENYARRCGNYPCKVNFRVEVVDNMEIYDKFYFKYSITNIVGKEKPKQNDEVVKCRRVGGRENKRN